MDTQLSVHRYSPLGEPDSIRILVLEPALDSAAELRGHFVYTTLSHCANDLFDGYIALSYVWGDPTTNCSIIIHDGETIRITTSLHIALRDIRDTSRRLRVWADAICINQSDILERNTQVELMGDIYRDATITVVYVDPAPESTMKRMLELVMSSRLEQISADEQQDVLNWCELYLVTRPWFTRVWVLQEFVLSRDPRVQCGRLRVRWRDLYSLVQQAMDKKFPNLNNLDSTGLGILKSLNTYRSEHSTLKLSNIMDDRRAYRATDPRDMVFAHMGLASDRTCISKYLRVDYSLPLREVYGPLGCYYLHTRGFEELISRAECLEPLEARRDVPSWAPDWRYPRAVSYPLVKTIRAPLSVYYRDMSQLDEVRRKTKSLVVSDNHLVLSTVGCSWDTIRFLSAPMPAHIHQNKSKKELRQIQTALEPFRKHSYYESDQTEDDHQSSRDAMKPLCDKILELLRGSTQGSSIESDSQEAFFDVFQDWLYREIAEDYHKPGFSRSILWHTISCYLGLSTRIEESGQSFYLGLSTRIEKSGQVDVDMPPLLHRRRLMYTCGGQFGFAPLHARPGDSVIVVPATRTPIVVRPLKVEGQEDTNEYISKQVRENISQVFLPEHDDVLHTGVFHTGVLYPRCDFNVRDVDILRVRHCFLLGECLIDGHYNAAGFNTDKPDPISLRHGEVYAIH